MRPRRDNRKGSSKGQSEAPRYQLVLSRAAAKDLQSLPPKLIKQLQNKCLPVLSVNPRGAGNPKHGPLAGLYSYNFGPRRGYRIVYEVVDSERLVVVIAIGPHDQAYRRARRRI
ncbi:MAG: type II toxin-antitoxin system RelE family toxin [Candidatus Bipolaricaulia bacterium]